MSHRGKGTGQVSVWYDPGMAVPCRMHSLGDERSATYTAYLEVEVAPGVDVYAFIGVCEYHRNRLWPHLKDDSPPVLP